MKIVKRLFLILLILIVLLLGAAFLVPVVFKDKLLMMAQDVINENVNAEVLIGDVDLTIFKSFPDLTLELNDLKINGSGPFKDITLASLERLMVTLDVMSVIKGQDISINSIGIVGPKVHALVLADGLANWDILKESEDTEETVEESTESGSFKLALDEYFIERGRIIYDDLSLGFRLDLFGLDHSGSGALDEDLFTLKTLTTADTVNVIYEGVPYLNRSMADLKVDLEMDMENAKYTFLENTAQIDQLPLKFDGYVAMPSDDIEMDLTFGAANTDLRYLLSLIPAEFMKDLEGVDVAGDFGLDGEVKGIYNDSLMPAFKLDLTVTDGRVAYPDLPKSIEAINIDAHINSPDGADMDKMAIDVTRCDVRIAEGPIRAKLKLRTPMSDPNIDLDLAAQLNLANLKDAMPLEQSEDLNGSVTADVKLKGAMSAIEEERYQDFHASGEVILLDMAYSSDSLPYDMGIDNAYLSFSPEFLEVTQLDVQIGNSDLAAKGRIDNYLAWLLKDETVKGSFDIQSQKFDLVELMGSSEGEAATTESTGADGVEEAMEVLEVPGNIDFQLTAGIKELIYDNLPMTDVVGDIRVKDRKAELSHFGMKVLDGTVKLNGAYATPEGSQPMVDFGFDIRNMNIKKSAEYIETIMTLAPIAKSCEGRYNAKMDMKCALDDKMEPVLSTLTGGGNVSTGDVDIKGFQPMVELAEALKIKEISSTKVNDVHFDYTFADGKVYIQPFDVKVDRLDATVAGSTSFEQEIDFVMNTEVPTDVMGGEAVGFISSLADDANKLGMNFSVGDKIKVDVLAKGTIDKPKIKVRPTGVGENIMETVKEEINKEIDRQKEKALEEAREQADKLMEEAEKQAQKVRDEAKKLADKLKEEGYAQAQKLEDDAKDPLAKIGAKLAADALRKETDKRAQQVIDEGNKNADKVLDAARKQADNLLEKAAEI